MSAITILEEIINSQELTQIVTEADGYLYAQFTIRWIGFVDDVEFFVNKPQGVIDV